VTPSISIAAKNAAIDILRVASSRGTLRFRPTVGSEKNRSPQWDHLLSVGALPTAHAKKKNLYIPKLD